jgi:hypothetical protein
MPDHYTEKARLAVGRRDRSDHGDPRQRRRPLDLADSRSIGSADDLANFRVVRLRGSDTLRGRARAEQDENDRSHTNRR